MEVEYASKKVEELLKDKRELQRKLGADLAKKIDKLHTSLLAARNLGIIKKINLWDQHRLHGDLDKYISYGLTKMIRFVIDAGLKTFSDKEFDACTKVTIIGVVDDHGKKYQWYIR